MQRGAVAPRGAWRVEQSLHDSVVACLVEAWPAPVHHGQHTAAEVEALLNQAGFLCFEHRERHTWRRKSPVGYPKPQLAWTEALYFRAVIGTPELATWPVARLLKAVALADLYGHLDCAVPLSSTPAATQPRSLNQRQSGGNLSWGGA